jgi:hypothetical protein
MISFGQSTTYTGTTKKTMGFDVASKYYEYIRQNHDLQAQVYISFMSGIMV